MKERYNRDGQKWAVVTGASKGIGKSLALALASKGFNLLLMARSQEALASLCQQIERQHAGQQARYLVVDAGEPWQGSGGLGERLAAFVAPYQVSVLINNVGVAPSLLNEMTEHDSAHIDNLIAVNCAFTTQLTRLLVPKLKQQPRSWIANVGSASAVDSMPYFACYSASKGFLSTLSLALASELSDYPIDVQVFIIGPVATEMTGVDKPNLLFLHPDKVAAKIVNSAAQGPVVTPFLIHRLYSTLRVNFLWDLRLSIVKKLRRMQLERKKE